MATLSEGQKVSAADLAALGFKQATSSGTMENDYQTLPLSYYMGPAQADQPGGQTGTQWMAYPDASGNGYTIGGQKYNNANSSWIDIVGPALIGGLAGGAALGLLPGSAGGLVGGAGAAAAGTGAFDMAGSIGAGLGTAGDAAAASAAALGAGVAPDALAAQEATGMTGAFDLGGSTGTGIAGSTGAATAGGLGALGSAGSAASGASALGSIGSALKDYGGIIAPVLSGLGSAYAANSAANSQADAAKEANALQKYMYDTTRADNAPWQTAGAKAVGQMSSMTQPGYQFSTTDPSYQWRLDQGNKALANSAGARGGLLSGRAAKDTINYSQGAASQEFSNAYNRLYQLSGQGQNAASMTGNAGANYANQASNNITGAGAANAAGSIGAANALGSGLAGAYNNYQSGNALQSLVNANTATANYYNSLNKSGYGGT